MVEVNRYFSEGTEKDVYHKLAKYQIKRELNAHYMHYRVEMKQKYQKQWIIGNEVQ